MSGEHSSVVSDSKEDVCIECRVRGSDRKLGEGGVGEFIEENRKCRGPVGLSFEGRTEFVVLGVWELRGFERN